MFAVVAVPLVIIAGIAAGAFQRAIPASNAVLSEHELEEIEHLPPQQQAQRLLQRAVNGYDGALEQITKRVDSWRGSLRLDADLQGLTQTAYNSSDLRVRAASVEISLAAYGLEKKETTVESLVSMIQDTEDDREWRLWVLGLLGNRGVAAGTARRAIEDRLRDARVETRKGLLGNKVTVCEARFHSSSHRGTCPCVG
jgi:hypothetical protein